MDAELIDQLKRIAEEEQRSITNLVTRWVKQKIEEVDTPLKNIPAVAEKPTNYSPKERDGNAANE